ncbi:MAG: polysaccharide biosynthesis protein [Clostridia bacterium]|nr:polysaccharide biosynthesis protein [Clostridia bacterium]
MTGKKLLRIFLFVLADIFAVAIAGLLTNLARCDIDFGRFLTFPGTLSFIKMLPYLTFLTLVVFNVQRLYNSLWEFAGTKEFVRIIISSLISSLIAALIIVLTKWEMQRSFYFVYPVVLSVLSGGVRLVFRYLRRLRNASVGTKRTMIIGAGSAGSIILKEIRSSSTNINKPICFIDSDPSKWNTYIDGIKIVGGNDKILEAAEKFNIDEIIIAVPSMSVSAKKEILKIVENTGLSLKTLPSISQISSDDVLITKLRNVSVEDLLEREPIKIDLTGIRKTIENKTIMVTGGGGSIGSELCRQIAGYNPKQLIIFDIYENNAYEIQQELKNKHPDLDLEVLIGSVRDVERLNGVFEKYHPQMVFHAAAHKHVPLMEDSPNEAIKNNVFGTYNVAEACRRYNAERMLLVSTDKAVNPTNVMGASKRICEMIVQMFNNHSETTDYVAVRFGNVLGSNGSVIPLFKKQIEAGGPVTVTDPNIIRYFMTIPEAVSLILEAGSFARGGEIFVLDMGEPVRIDDMARRMIKLSGFTPDEDIKIVYTGLRPGEKLYEELLMSEEGMKKTANELIYIGNPIDFDEDRLKECLSELSSVMEDDSYDIRELIKKAVSTYNPAKN